MKKLIFTLSFIILIASIKLDAKSLNDNKKQLTNTLGQKVSMNDIIDDDQDIIVLFWDSNNRNHIDILEDYYDMENDSINNGDRKVIAICSDKHHNYQQLDAYVAGKGWDIDVYVDINNSYKRSKGLLDRLFYAYIPKDQSFVPTIDTSLENNELQFSAP